jgi:hypothetical protein
MTNYADFPLAAGSVKTKHYETGEPPVFKTEPAADAGEKCETCGKRASCCEHGDKSCKFHHPPNGTGRKPADDFGSIIWELLAFRDPKTPARNDVVDRAIALLRASRPAQDSCPHPNGTTVMIHTVSRERISGLTGSIGYEEMVMLNEHVRAVNEARREERASRPAMTGEEREACKHGAAALRVNHPSWSPYRHHAATLEAMAKGQA